MPPLGLSGVVTTGSSMLKLMRMHNRMSACAQKQPQKTVYSPSLIHTHTCVRTHKQYIEAEEVAASQYGSDHSEWLHSAAASALVLLKTGCRSVCISLACT